MSYTADHHNRRLFKVLSPSVSERCLQLYDKQVS